ncbi:ATP-binding cassette domain-containing protein [Plantactinospora sp. KLBMP9567]|uniref:ATP-binding cassette domain-containing protein n=1 Tax=Plantactinospora sp. KLBMP9567 TaxID=3085900 RepID=UPI002981485C|nr:ATP-binding cassette domain-containing protein [Plantactinospora sp. KLBMP9567]MDW5328806.1 ATP-binding cassette domain-containing protein [Plantactinospora sp. KLBMP9567]
MIETIGLGKTFRGRRGQVEAVRGVDLVVEPGEIFGFLGPNGAGKTTTVRMLATLLRPSFGRATVFGADLVEQPAEVRRHIGYVGQRGGTDPTMTAWQELIIQGRFQGMTKSAAQARAQWAVDAFELGECADRRTGTYSGGQRRRLDLALGMVHSPRLVFLDEPTAGLDPQSRANLWVQVRRLREEGMTVFLTTHYLDEADALCDRLVIIDHGQVAAEGTPQDLKREIAGDIVAVGVAGDPKIGRKLLAEQPFVREVDDTDQQTIRLYVDKGDTALPQVMRLLDANGLELRSITLERPSLDDVFLRKTGRSLRDAK